MKRPATATIVVFAAIIVVVAVIAGVVWTTTDGAPAVRVADTQISRADLNDELREWSRFSNGQIDTTSAAIASEASVGIVSRVVWGELVKRYLKRVGEHTTAAEREEIVTSAGPALRERPKWFQDRVIEREASFSALNRVIGGDEEGTDALRVLRREARRAGVTVDDAYGRWVPDKAQVRPYKSQLAAGQS